MSEVQTIICQCGLITEACSGPTHSYIQATPGCWKLYGEVLVREYSDPQYWRMHRLTVDAYSVQHPDGDDPRAIQSVTVHLVGLYITLVKKLSAEFATQIIGKIIQKNKGKFILLERPKNLGKITIQDVWQAKNAEQHEMVIAQWAQSVWEAWQQHHDYIASLAEPILNQKI